MILAKKALKNEDENLLLKCIPQLPKTTKALILSKISDFKLEKHLGL